MIYRKAGYLTLGSRLKRLGDRVLNEVRTVYRQAGIHFETSWFPVFYVLREEGMCSVLELSAMLEVSHSAVSQLISQLERRKLIEVRSSTEDQRKKEIVLTKEGEQLMERILPVWRAFELSFREHLDQQIPDALDRLEQSLESGKISGTALDILEGSGTAPDIRLMSEPSPQVMAFSLEHDLSCMPESKYIVLFADGFPVGLLCYSAQTEGILLGEVFVIPALRGRGHGIQLLDMLDETEGRQSLILQRTTPEILQLLHRSGHSFLVDLNHEK